MNICTRVYKGPKCLSKNIDKPLSVQDLIREFCEPEQLTEENSWFCRVCNAPKLPTKTMKFHEIGEYLIIHLKRFNNTNNLLEIYG